MPGQQPVMSPQIKPYRELPRHDTEPPGKILGYPLQQKVMRSGAASNAPSPVREELAVKDLGRGGHIRAKSASRGLE